MVPRRLRLTLVLASLLAACGPSKDEHARLQAHAKQLEGEVQKLTAEVQTLRTEIEEAKFGAGRLFEAGRVAADAGKLEEARAALEDLLSRHSSAPEAQQARSLLARVKDRISKAEASQRREQEQHAREARQAVERATRNLKKRVDEIKNITWMSHRNTSALGKSVTLYFGTRDDSAASFPLRIRFQYEGDDWLFCNGLTIKADDQVYELPGLEFKHENDSETVWEMADLQVVDYAMLDKILQAKRVVVRFNGQNYYSDFTLPAGQKSAMQDVYTAWRTLGGNP